MICRASGLGGLAVALGVACAPDPVTTESVAITNGTTSATDRAVVALAHRRETCPQPAPGVFCSGVVLAPRLVLTAAHCFSELFAEGRGLDELEIFAGTDAGTGAGDWRAVQAVRLHPGYDPPTRVGDLALVLVDADLASVTPLALGTLPGDTSAVGRTVRLVGFGVTEASVEPGVRRTGTATIESYDETTVRLSPSPSLSCAGDSGGAVLFDDGGGERLVAVIRSGDAGCNQFSVATRTDAYAMFISPALDATDPLTGDTRLPPDLDVDFCAGECATDLDCPDGMRCLDERVARRCGYSSIRSGNFGAACTSSADCGGSICAGVGAGVAHACRCLETCPTPSADGGCSVGRGGLGDGMLALSSFVLVCSRRRRQRTGVGIALR